MARHRVTLGSVLALAHLNSKLREELPPLTSSQPTPKRPTGHARSHLRGTPSRRLPHLFPVHPGRQRHSPLVLLQLAPFMQSQGSRHFLPWKPKGQAARSWRREGELTELAGGSTPTGRALALARRGIAGAGVHAETVVDAIWTEEVGWAFRLTVSAHEAGGTVTVTRETIASTRVPTTTFLPANFLVERRETCIRLPICWEDKAWRSRGPSSQPGSGIPPSPGHTSTRTDSTPSLLYRLEEREGRLTGGALADVAAFLAEEAISTGSIAVLPPPARTTLAGSCLRIAGGVVGTSADAEAASPEVTLWTC